MSTATKANEPRSGKSIELTLSHDGEDFVVVGSKAAGASVSGRLTAAATYASKLEAKGDESGASRLPLALLPSEKLSNRQRLATSRKRRMAAGVSVLPPPVEQTAQLHGRKMMFFAQSSVTNVIVNAQDIVSALGGICTVANSTIVPWTSSFRINSVEIYPPSDTVSTAVPSGGLWWNASSGNQFVKDTQVVAAIPGGVTNTERLRYVPPKKSLASDWITQYTGASTLNVFQITVSQGGIVILNVDCTLSNAQVSSPQTGVTTCSLGGIYYLALDGRATNLLRPVDLNTTS